MTSEDITNKYVINGEVARNKVALDIKYRKLDRTEIERLSADPGISSGFIGSSFNAKKKKKYWNKSYLDELSYAAIAESFNRDYLLYLDEVAEFVSNSGSAAKKLIISGVIIVILIIAGIIVARYVRSDRPVVMPPVESVPAVESTLPVESAPAESTLPVESAPDESVPAESMPPDESAPVESASTDESATVESIHEESAPPGYDEHDEGINNTDIAEEE